MNLKIKVLYLLVIIVLIVGASFFYFSKKQGTTGISNNNQTFSQEVYTNTKYNFSIKYPCDKTCEQQKPRPYVNAYVDEQINLPTRSQAVVTLSTFTDAKVIDWNKTVNDGPGAPFPFDLNSLQKATTLQLDSKCSVLSYDNSKSFNCNVVNIGGKKAIEFINSVPRSSNPNRVYLIQLKDKEWLKIIENYFGLEQSDDFLTNSIKITPEIQKEIDATKEVIGSLKFN